MTNAQKWVAAFLFLFVALFALSKVTKNGGDEYNDLEYIMNNSSNEEIDAPTLISNLGCAKCHGENLDGTSKGPNLRGVGENWTRNDLINYFRNPSSYGKGTRFDEYRKIYPIEMRSFNSVELKSLGKIADYILKLK
ncbi:MAG: cytochrome c [Chlorobi bacterium]|nr:cytochrome c [Chlorobiota bacterium]